MPKIVNLGNNPSSNVCNDISPVSEDLREKVGKFCEGNEEDPCQELGRNKKVGINANCDPMQSGSIINEMTNSPTKIINRYSNAIRGCDQGMLSLFKNLVVLDEDGKAHPVPIIYGSQEKAVAYVMQNNVRKDNTLVVDRPTLPLLAIHQSDMSFNQARYIYHKAQRHPVTSQELFAKNTIFGIARGIPIDVGYTLYAWTLFLEDMNQILEQILLKFSPMSYINIQGIPWEIGVKLDSMANNIDTEAGDQNVRVVKYQFNFTVETYIPQPITRNRTVLKMKTDIYNSVNEEEIITNFNRDEIGTNE